MEVHLAVEVQLVVKVQLAVAVGVRLAVQVQVQLEGLQLDVEVCLHHFALSHLPK